MATKNSLTSKTVAEVRAQRASKDAAEVATLGAVALRGSALRAEHLRVTTKKLTPAGLHA